MRCGSLNVRESAQCTQGLEAAKWVSWKHALEGTS
jgi:hypothetical protein